MHMCHFNTISIQRHAFTMDSKIAHVKISTGNRVKNYAVQLQIAYQILYLTYDEGLHWLWHLLHQHQHKHKISASTTTKAATAMPLRTEVHLNILATMANYLPFVRPTYNHVQPHMCNVSNTLLC